MPGFLERANFLIAAARKAEVPVIFSRITPLPELFESPVRRFLAQYHGVRMSGAAGGLDLTIPPLASVPERSSLGSSAVRSYDSVYAEPSSASIGNQRV
jgi:nicotinamidase-related amidase